MTHVIPPLLLDRLTPRRGMLGATALLVLVAAADYATGYEVRLSILYLAPIGLATWTAGAMAGAGVAAAASLCWLLSFRSAHFYANQGYYFWEGGVMLAGFLALVLLLARLRRALTHADERFVRVLEEMQAAVYVMDEPRGELLYANQQMKSLVGDTAAAAVRHFEAALQADDVAAEASPTPLGEGFAADTVRDPRSRRWYHASSLPWGRRPGVRLKVLTDITEQKTAEVQRQKHLELMYQAARLSTLAEIAATLAHEINQPLMVIASYTDACQRLLATPGHDPAEVTAALGKCRAQVVRAASIIERLRDFIRRRQHQPALCDANLVATEAANIMQIPLTEGQVTLNLSLLRPSAKILADRTLLVQVLINLMRNAIEAMQEVAADARRLALTVALREDDQVVFSVADRGPGLNEIQTANLFVPFFTTKPEGLGLGLAICRSVAEAHEGRLWAESNLGGGVVFHLSIPPRESL